MANILTDAEAANVLRCAVDDENMLDLLPLVDAYIERATGRDWTLDTSIRPEAKAAARMLLVRWHEDPGAMGSSELGLGFRACLSQLEALAELPEISGVPAEVLALSSHNMGAEMALDANLVLVFNHQMASGSTSYVTLKNSAGTTVSSAKSLDVSSKIMTINPTSNLTGSSTYTVDIEGAADIYGQTLDTEVSFETAS